MSEEEVVAVQGEAVIPEAIVVGDSNSVGGITVIIRSDPFAPPADRNSFERHVQRNLAQETEPEARGRGRTRAGTRSRYVSSSPPVDRAAEIALQNVSDRDVIGAPRAVWNELISQFRRQANDNDRDMLPPHLVMETMMRRFTRLNLDAGEQPPPSDSDSDDEEIPANYVECIYVKATKTYHKVYVGDRGGKFFYNHNGQKKYVKNHNDVSFANPDVIPIINNNPVLNTTTVTSR